MNSKKLFNLDGKVAIVTGGTGHLGKSMAEGLAEMGAHVFITSREKSKALETKNSFSEDIIDRIDVEELDILSLDSIKKCFNRIKNNSNKIDILVNNAGNIPSGNYENMSEKVWNDGMDGLINGVFRCTKEIIPIMEQNGESSIINIASMYGVVSPDPSIYEESGFNSLPNYGASKAAIIQYTKYLACHLGGKQIRVNSISPGPFPKEEVQKNVEFINQLKKKVPMGRIGLPEELKGVVVFLASNASSYITGENILVDGGWTSW
jgi:NAD(P)-dependent dehydrogenase (short-subunit alcohol dehydrogenase family)